MFEKEINFDWPIGITHTVSIWQFYLFLHLFLHLLLHLLAVGHNKRVFHGKQMSLLCSHHRQVEVTERWKLFLNAGHISTVLSHLPQLIWNNNNNNKWYSTEPEKLPKNLSVALWKHLFENFSRNLLWNSSIKQVHFTFSLFCIRHTFLILNFILLISQFIANLYQLIHSDVSAAL